MLPYSKITLIQLVDTSYVSGQLCVVIRSTMVDSVRLCGMCIALVDESASIGKHENLCSIKNAICAESTHTWRVTQLWQRETYYFAS